jgi:hypothetical protein
MLTTLDAVIDELEAMVNRLSRRSAAGLYWACSSALAPFYVKWATEVGVQSEAALGQVLATAYEFAVSGREPDRTAELLQALESSTPPGELLYRASKLLETAAQDCWICADATIRTLVDPSLTAGRAIWYALEPVLQHATERLFGVLQVGSGPDEYRQIESVMSEPDVSAATDFVRWAVNFLEGRPAPAAEDLELMGQRAMVLRPDGLA